MILEDSKGNVFNVELCLEVERDSGELLLLAEALYEKLKVVEEGNALLKLVVQAKDDVVSGRTFTSEEFKEKLKLKKEK